MEKGEKLNIFLLKVDAQTAADIKNILDASDLLLHIRELAAVEKSSRKVFSSPKNIILVGTESGEGYQIDLLQRYSTGSGTAPVVILLDHLSPGKVDEHLQAGASDVMWVQDLDRLPYVIRRINRDLDIKQELQTKIRQYRDQEEQFRLMAENSIDVIWQMDLRLNFTYVSPSIEKLTGYTQEEWVGSNLKEHANWKEFYKMARAAVGGIKNYREFDYVTIQSRILRKDKSEIPVEIIGKLMLNEKGFPVGLQGSTRDISERIEVEIRNQRLLKQQTAAFELTLALGEAHDLDQIYMVIYRHVKNLMDVTSFIISFFNPDTEHISAGFVISKGEKLDVSSLPDLPLGAPGRGTQSRVIHSGEPYYTPDYREAVASSKKEYVIDQDGKVGEGPPPDYDPEITRSAVFIPLKEQNEVIGVMQIQSFGLDAYTREDVDLLQSLAGVASIAIQNARLIDAEKKRREISETLVGITSALISTLELDEVLEYLLQELSRVIEFDTASLILLDGDVLQIVASVGFEDPEFIKSLTFPLDENFPNYEVMQKKEPVMYQDVSSRYPVFKEDAETYDSGWIKSWLGVPLLVKDKVIGMIAVDRKENIQFSKDEINLAEAFANQAATLIENTRLYSQSKRQLARLETLRQIDQTITSSLDLSLSLNVFLALLMEQLDVDAAGLYLYQDELQQLEFYLGKGFINQSWIEKEIRLGQGLVGKAALDRKSIYIKEISSKNQFELPEEAAKKEGFVSYYSCPLINKGNLVGLLEIFQRSVLNANPEWVRFLEMLTRQASIAVESVTQFDELEQSNINLMLAYDATLEKAVKALEARGFEPPGHSRRVIDTAVKIGVQMGLSSRELVSLRRGSLIHDLGMLAMPDSIVLKPGKLEPGEMRRIQEHPRLAYEWFSGVELLREALEIPLAHHERWDGSGYPRGLEGKQIPLNARIFSIVDVWDILKSERPYRAAWDLDKIYAYLDQQSGLDFDPDIVRVFFKIVKKEAQ